MRIAVVAASGRTGRAVVTAARLRGHEVVAVVRRSNRLTVAADAVREADAGDPRALAAAFDGTDAVLWCVGPVRGEADGVMSRTILATLKTVAHRRLVVVSASGPFTEGDGWALAHLVKPIVTLVLRSAFRDIAATDALVQASGVAWTIIRPPQLTDAAGRGYRSARGTNVKGGFRVTRADLADAMLDALDDPTTIRAVISIAN